ncbi:MAG TPA: hypothetical protein VD859_01375 [Nocardioides sp.]|nr:hypothetical protein [Nocardioides sp.]
MASTLLAGSFEAAAAAAPVAGTAQNAAAPSSCASPPSSPDATPENRQRFVELWLDRFKDQAWLDEYTARDEVPAEILAEGFHAMGDATKAWLSACLLDAMLEFAGDGADAERRDVLLTGINLVIFGKQQMAELRQELNEPEPAPPTAQQPAPEGQTGEALEEMSEELAGEPSLTSEDHPTAEGTAPSTDATTNQEAAASPRLRRMLSADPTPTSLAPPGELLAVDPVQRLLNAIGSLQRLVSEIQGKLFTLPGLNILAPAFYKICAESPSMPLKCSVSLPVGLPIPADVTGDNLPDVTGWLAPLTNLKDVGAKFQVLRLFPNSGPLKAHVFAVYDTPIVKKRIQFGFDGRSSTLGKRTEAEFHVRNVLAAAAGDVQLDARLFTVAPGASQSLTFGVKSLVGGSAGVLPTETDPVVGAVQMSPVPDRFTVDARLTHTTAKDRDLFNVTSTVPTKVNAVIDQSTTATTTSPGSTRRFTAEIDKLPTSVTVDLVRNGGQQTIDYTANAPIDRVKASTKAIPNVSDPTTYTESIYEVSGVPKTLGIDLTETETAEGSDLSVQYTADAKVPEVAFQTRTLDEGDLATQISAKAHQIPKAVGITSATTEQQSAFTYTSDEELQDVELAMYSHDKEKDDTTNLQATASGIPTQMGFTMAEETGVYDFTAPDGIDLIEGSLTLDEGQLLPMPGQDHATVHKVDEAIGLDFRLSGFSSAHFDGSSDTFVELGLNPGGQSFDAIADLNDPDVLAKAHVAELPRTMSVRVSPEGESATYTGATEIPLIRASIDKRDTGDKLGVEIEGVPTEVGLLFDADAATIGWDASGTTDRVSAVAELTAATLESDRDFDAGLTITSIPAEWDATWAGGNVLWEAPAPGIGSIDARVTNHDENHVLPGDHLSAYYREASGDLDASLRVSELDKVAFTKLAGENGGGFEASLNMGNHGALAFAADVVTSEGVLDATGHFDNLPSEVTLRSEGGVITYDGDSNPDLTVSVKAGESAAALAATPEAPDVHGVSVRDGKVGEDRAVKAKLYLTGLPDHLDLDSPAGIYEVDGYHPTIGTLVVDAVLTTIAEQPLSLQVQQVVPTAAPVDFTFGPFVTETAPDGTRTLAIDYVTSQTLGSLTANAQYGTDEAQLSISEIPSTIHVGASFGAARKNVNVSMSHGISDITASYKTTQATEFLASVHLHDVPSTVDVTLGRDTASGGDTTVTAPDFTMTASQPGLDISATAAAEIVEPADLKAEAALQITDLGQTVTGTLEGTGLHVTSSPATGSFLLSAAGEVSVDANLDFHELIFKNVGTLDVHVDIKQVTVGFQNASDLVLDLGVTTGLRGDFTGFQFGLDTDTAIEVHDTLSVFIDWPDPLGTTDWEVANLHANIDFGNVLEAWHVNRNQWGNFASLSLFGCGAHLDLLPGPGFKTANSSTLNLGPVPDAPDGFTDAWLITPDANVFNLSLPSWAMDLVAFFASPYDTDWDVRIGC